MAKTEKVAPSEVVRQPTAMEIVEHTRVMYHITAAKDVEPRHLESPDFWAHIAHRLRPGDRIEVVPEDRHYFVELFVLASASNWAKVKTLRVVELIPDHEKTEDEGFTIEWAGRAKWRVLKGDSVLTSEHDTKEQALAWLKEHKKEIR